jgi:hypothetical protein
MLRAGDIDEIDRVVQSPAAPTACTGAPRKPSLMTPFRHATPGSGLMCSAERSSAVCASTCRRRIGQAVGIASMEAGEEDHGFSESTADRLGVLAELLGEGGSSDLDEIDGPVFWPAVSARDAVTEWESLRSWVDQLVGRFALDQRVVPSCWYRHNALVEALCALRDHQRACYSATAPPTAAVDWHRAFRDIEARMRGWASRTQCSANHHGDDQVRPSTAAASDWQQWLEADVARRKRAAVAQAVAGDLA